MTIKIFRYMFIKKALNEKKCLRIFNKKNTFICWTRLKTEKLYRLPSNLSERTLFPV